MARTFEEIYSQLDPEKKTKMQYIIGCIIELRRELSEDEQMLLEHFLDNMK